MCDDITYEMQKEKNLELSYHPPTLPQKMSEAQRKLNDILTPKISVEMVIGAFMRDFWGGYDPSYQKGESVSIKRPGFPVNGKQS